MPEISQQYRNQRLAPLSGVGQLSSADIQAATQGNRSAAKTGEALTEFGVAFIQEKEKAEFHNQLNSSKTEYLTKFFDYEQDLQTNADTETYIPNLKAGQTSSYKFTNKRAANEFELWKANEDLSQTRRVFGAKQTQDVQNYTQNWNLGIKEATRRTASALQESDYQLELANGMDYFGLEYATEDKDGEPVPVLDEKGNPKIQLIEDWENPLLDTDEVRMAGYESWKADADVKRAGIIRGNVTTAGFDAWQATVDIEDPDGKLQVGIDIINASGLPEPEKQKARTSLETQVRNSRAETELESQQVTDNSINEIKGKLNNGEFDGIHAFIKAQPITEIEKNKQIISANSYISSVNNSNKKANFVTSDETNIQVDGILRRTRSGELSYDEAISEYKKVSKDVKATEGKTNLDNISTAAESADVKKNPVLGRPEVKRGQASLDRVRSAAISVLDRDDGDYLKNVADIGIAFLRNQTILDKWADANADDPDFTRKWQQQVSALSRPAIEDVTLGFLEKFIRRKEGKLGAALMFVPGGPGLAGFLLDTEEEAIARKRFKTAEESETFQAMSQAGKDSVAQSIIDGRTAQQAIDIARANSVPGVKTNKIEVPENTPKDQAAFDAFPSGTLYIDTDGEIVRKP
jgi:hypothetical protein